MYAYTTLLLGDNYLPGVIALSRSLTRVNTQTPLLVLFDPQHISSQQLQQLAKETCELVEVEPLPVSSEFLQRHSRKHQHRKNPFTKGNKPVFHNPAHNFYKLCLWTLIQYQKIIFLDADTIVLRNIDHLFEYPEGSAAPNLYETLADFNRMNSGVFVAKPSLPTFDSMIKVLDGIDAYWPRTDQTFLQHYWQNWHGLPYIYNALQYLYFNIPALWQWQQIHVVHYQYEKPWEADHPKTKQLLPLIALWQAIYHNEPIPPAIAIEMAS